MFVRTVPFLSRVNASSHTRYISFSSPLTVQLVNVTSDAVKEESSSVTEMQSVYMGEVDELEKESEVNVSEERVTEPASAVMRGEGRGVEETSVPLNESDESVSSQLL